MAFFNKKEYTLENVIKQNKLYPRSFLKPNDDEITNIKIGDTVKLIFLMKKPQSDGCRAERMWVIVKEIKDGCFYGELDNQPYYLKTIKAGNTISFLAENIATIMYHDIATFDENKFAIITRKALKKREVNWLLKTSDINNDQDSGWQLFFGDEDEEYLENHENSTLVSLGNVLNFEPLLEIPFTSSGSAYEYSKVQNAFIEVKN